LITRFAIFLSKHWQRLPWPGRALFVFLVLSFGLLTGMVIDGDSGLIKGGIVSAVILVILSSLVGWREPGKTVLAQMFFFPMALIGVNNQLPIIAPLAPAPTITVTPLILWVIISTIVVHTTRVSHQWVRAVVVVQIAAFSGWLFGDFFGPVGVALGYIASAIVLYVLTWGWEPLMGSLVRKRLKQNLGSVYFPNGEGIVNVSPILAHSLGVEWVKVENVLIPVGKKDIRVPLVLVGPSGVYVVDKRKYSGVTRENSEGLTIGGQSKNEELGAYAITVDALARIVNVSADLVRAVIVIEGAPIRNGRSLIALFSGNDRVFDVVLIREELLRNEVTDFPLGKMSEKLQNRTVGRLKKLESTTWGAGASEVKPADIIAPSDAFTCEADVIR
jgi:hypothetical protein